MATGTSYPAADPPRTVVIGPQYCVDHPIDLTILRKGFTFSSEKYVVKDVNGNLMFRVKGKRLVDAAGNTVVTFRQKSFSCHKRFKVFRGESKKAEDLLFSVKKSSLLQLKMNLHVFMASNTAEEVCDFKIKGSFFETSCVVYAASSDKIIAQMKKNSGFLCVNHTFGVAVHPNVDYAFVVVLIVPEYSHRNIE
ncbi:Protein LURP-one-related 15 [Striga hermonthica]|uniref:Protein LURP-one-related 15 n=1 Tax=Striga hermonthica TaxID=68872 RepID=A0A9N7RMJ5_STRHE|nr:Protein LURP-one-related 15 [Striga hermonthica]